MKRRTKNLPVLVVGAGFAGSVVARQLADAGFLVLLIEKRSHIGGNAYDCLDSEGVLIHPYGPHIFHTNSDSVYNYLSRFTKWRFYEHRSLSYHDGDLYPFPINIKSLNKLFGLNLDAAGIEARLESCRVSHAGNNNFEDYLISTIGRAVYEKFFYGYAKKLWHIEPRELSASLAARVQVRFSHDDRYFLDKYQGLPGLGYTRMFENLLDHPNIELCLDTHFEEGQYARDFSHIIYTGPISEYFNNVYGALPYRSLHFEHQHISDKKQYQEVGSVNYPNGVAYTRISEFKHMTGQSHSGTSIVKEFPIIDGEPYYPVPDEASRKLYRCYKALAEQKEEVSFVGRLAQYQYYNMDQVVASALKLSTQLVHQFSR